MTEPLHAVCAAVPEAAWTLCADRPDETVPWAEVEFTPGDWPRAAWPLRYLVLQIRRKQGHLCAGPDTKSLAVGSNRAGAVPDLLRWHWQKAGTIELVHDVTKNELGVRRRRIPPCGRCGANAAWYRRSLLTDNVLSALKALARPAPRSAARPKRLRFPVFPLAGRIVSHAARLLLRVGTEAERLAGLIAARLRLALVAQALPAG